MLYEFLQACTEAVPGLTGGDLLVLGCAWLRITIDGDDPEGVARWAKRLMATPSQNMDAVMKLRAEGLSVRSIANRTGFSKSTIARKLSQNAA